MKLRIKGNSIRIRLSKTEVVKISTDGYIEEQTQFGNNKFIYALKKSDTGNELSASLEQNKITMYVPSSLLNGWPENDVVGFKTHNNDLFLLLEKDFVCLDETFEDQTDNYDNPNKTC